MDEGKFWLNIIAIIGGVIVIIAFVIAGYWVNHNSKVVELIKLGVPPTEAMCALQDDYGMHPVCLVAASKGK